MILTILILITVSRKKDNSTINSLLAIIFFTNCSSLQENFMLHVCMSNSEKNEKVCDK